jgi:hypothetical protein
MLHMLPFHLLAVAAALTTAPEHHDTLHAVLESSNSCPCFCCHELSSNMVAICRALWVFGAQYCQSGKFLPQLVALSSRHGLNVVITALQLVSSAAASIACLQASTNKDFLCIGDVVVLR